MINSPRVCIQVQSVYIEAQSSHLTMNVTFLPIP